MAKDSDRLAGSLGTEATGGALSGLLAEEDEFDRRTLWRLGSWAAVTVGAVIVAILATQSSMEMRRELTASADLARQTQQIQLAARDNLSETRRLSSAVETLNTDRDRLYSRIAALEQGLDSVTGAIARQGSPPPSSSQSATSAAAPSAEPSGPSSSPAAPATPAAATATPGRADPPAASKPTTASAPAPTVATVAATAPSTTEKPSGKPAAAEPSAAQASISVPAPATTPPSATAPAQPVASLVGPKSMMAPPDPAAAKLIEPATPPKTIISAPIPDVTASVSKNPEEDASPAAPELPVKRTEFGVDVGGANSIAGLRALWRGLLKSKVNAALTTLHPIIVIKENGNGLGMQLRLLAGPINDAATAAKICATLTVSDRGCTTAIFEGQRLALSPEEQAKSDTQPAPAIDTASVALDAKPADAKPAAKPPFQKRYSAKRSPKDETPKAEQPSTMSLIFGRR